MSPIEASSEALTSTLPSNHPGSPPQESVKAQTSLALSEFSKKTVKDWPLPPGCKGIKIFFRKVVTDTIEFRYIKQSYF